MIQSRQNFVIDQNRLDKFEKKSYRDGYLDTRVRNGIARQVQAIRTKLRLSQTQFGDLVGKKQAVISRLEDPDNSGLTIKSLLDIASGAGVALLVQFVSYPEFLRRTADMSDRALQPETIHETLNSKAIDNNNAYTGAWYQAADNVQTQQLSTNLLTKPHNNAPIDIVSRSTTAYPNTDPKYQISGLHH